MKRSQMIDLIHKKLDGLPIDWSDWENTILTAVEECGMVPPAYWDESVGYVRSTGDYGFERYDWEPEEK